MDEFNWYYENINNRETLLEYYREVGVKQAHVTDYWWFINRMNKIKLEIYTLEEMAHEKGIYVI